MTGRRRRDGDPDPAGGRAQAEGPRSDRSRQVQPRRRGAPGGARRDAAGNDGGNAGAPRVRGAWTTPSVVVRGPDGQIVDGDGPRGGGRTGSAPAGPPGRAPGRRRVRPRRIPGAPGSVLTRPTLLAEAADGREARRRRRQQAPAATVTPLPPRPPVQAAPGSRADAGEPALLPVAGDGSRAPSPSRPGEPRRQRVLQALAALDRGRAPLDDDEAERREARRQRIGRGLTVAAVGALVAVVIYVVFPVRAGLDQRAAAERARERLEVFQRENALLEAEARELRDDEYIEELAREMGLVLPGEESYGILPAPQQPAPDSTATTRPGD